MAVQCINSLSTSKGGVEIAVQLPMDGFHYYKKQLDAMPNPQVSLETQKCVSRVFIWICYHDQEWCKCVARVFVWICYHNQEWCKGQRDATSVVTGVRVCVGNVCVCVCVCVRMTSTISSVLGGRSCTRGLTVYILKHISQPGSICQERCTVDLWCCCLLWMCKKSWWGGRRCSTGEFCMYQVSVFRKDN